MNERELYRRKKQAQLDEWKAEIDKLKAKASGASAEAQLDMKARVKALESQIEKGRSKLSELAGATDEAWESVKESMESTWASLKSAVTEPKGKSEP